MIDVAQLKELASDMTLLCVEDEERIRLELEQLLSKFFFSVTTARNGKEALEL
ncbi:MAG: response regulator [Campylobacterales bacterium]